MDTVQSLCNKCFRDFLIPFKLMQDAYFTAQYSMLKALFFSSNLV